MTLPTNILQQVETYQDSSLAYLQNLCCVVANANKRFQNFEKLTANLGSSVTFTLPTRYLSTDGLVISKQPTVQRVQTLTASQSANTSYAFSDEQFIFNAEQYMDEFGKSAMQELGSRVEIDVAKNAISGVRNALTGQLQTDSGPYRFYGDGVTMINSYQQLATMITLFKNYGSVQNDIKVFLPDIIIPGIIGTGLNQFAPRRNDADAMSWEIGEFGSPPVQYYSSNLLPIHYAGNVGEDRLTLTLVSTNDPTGNNITQLTFSGAGASDLNAVKAGDLFQFQDNVGSYPNLRYLTFIGHTPSANPVQFRATADAISDVSGNVTISITPALVSASGNANVNLNYALQAGMQVKSVPSHIAGMVIGGNALFVAMPRLPGTSPFVSSSKTDPDTGVSMRSYYGFIFGQAQQSYVNDIVWGSTLVPEYSMRILIPLSQLTI